MKDNDDLAHLRLVAAIAANASLSAAATQLNISLATAFRRIEAFEAKLGVKLFERSRGRYTPTAAGEELARAGAEIEREALESMRRVAGRDLRPSGLVRITTTDSIANGLIPPIVQACRRELPDIRLQVNVSNAIYDLSKRDADIALRPTRNPPGHLIGKSIGTIAMAVYAAPDYLRRQPGRTLAEHDWIAVDDSMGAVPSLEWLAAFKPLDALVYRTNSFSGIDRACAAGIGLAVLPCFLGDRSPQLVRVTGAIEACSNQLWMLAHPDMRETMRIKIVFQKVQHELEALLPLLSGQLFGGMEPSVDGSDLVSS